MEKFCMFSTVLLWSLVGSVMGCWERSGMAARSGRAQISTPEGTRSARTPTFSQKREKHGAPTFLEAVGKRPTQAKAACVGHPIPTLSPKAGDKDGAPSVCPVGYPPPPPPPPPLFFLQLLKLF